MRSGLQIFLLFLLAVSFGSGLPYKVVDERHDTLKDHDQMDEDLDDPTVMNFWVQLYRRLQSMDDRKRSVPDRLRLYKRGLRLYKKSDVSPDETDLLEMAKIAEDQTSVEAQEQEKRGIRLYKKALRLYKRSKGLPDDFLRRLNKRNLRQYK